MLLYLNAFCSILFTVLGIIIVFNPSTFENAPSPIAVTEHNTPSLISYGFTFIPSFWAIFISPSIAVFINSSPFITSNFSKYSSLISSIIVFIFPSSFDGLVL